MYPKDSVTSKEICDHLGGAPIADSNSLSWSRIRAQAYCYGNPYPGSWQIPWVEDGYLIEIQTSCHPVQLDQKITEWKTQYWQR
ncbi:MAG: hypothetical protein F6K16_42225, partial [Symploca sp. SIO2B6]|nr:hypothetical protein [Symploca sp. SIO2B6]